MENEEKLSLFKNLKLRIKDGAEEENEKEWFFLKEYGYDLDLNGFEGTQNIMFVALNPSKRKGSKIISKSDKFLSEKLNKFGFKNAHLTDLVKWKKTSNEIKEFLKDYQKMEKQLNYLREEIEIITPKIIVALGRKCEDILKKKFLNKIEIVIYLMHYSHRFKDKLGRNKEQAYEEDLKKIKEEYLHMGA